MLLFRKEGATTDSESPDKNSHSIKTVKQLEAAEKKQNEQRLLELKKKHSKFYNQMKVKTYVEILTEKRELFFLQFRKNSFSEEHRIIQEKIELLEHLWEKALTKSTERNQPSYSSINRSDQNYDYRNYNYNYRNYDYNYNSDSYVGRKSEESFLSRGAIVGIIFGCLAFIFFIYWCLKRLNKNVSEQRIERHRIQMNERRVLEQNIERSRNRGDLPSEHNRNQPNQRNIIQMDEHRALEQRIERSRNRGDIPSDHTRNQLNQLNRSRNTERFDFQNKLSPNAPNVQQDNHSFFYKGFNPPESEKMKKIIEKQTRNAKIIREPFAKPEFYVQCGEFFEDPPMFTPGSYRLTMSMVPDFYVLKLDVDDGGKISQPGQECEEIQNLTGLWFMPTGRVSLRFMFDSFLVQFRGEIENEEIQGRCKKGNELGTLKLKPLEAVGSLSSQQGFKDLTIPDFRFRFTQEFDGKVFDTSGEDNECIICCDKFIDCALTPCGHLCACSDCATKLKLCPICREVINQIVIPE